MTYPCRSQSRVIILSGKGIFLSLFQNWWFSPKYFSNFIRSKSQDRNPKGLEKFFTEGGLRVLLSHREGPLQRGAKWQVLWKIVVVRPLRRGPSDPYPMADRKPETPFEEPLFKLFQIAVLTFYRIQFEKVSGWNHQFWKMKEKYLFPDKTSGGHVTAPGNEPSVTVTKTKLRPAVFCSSQFESNFSWLLPFGITRFLGGFLELFSSRNHDPFQKHSRTF